MACNRLTYWLVIVICFQFASWHASLLYAGFLSVSHLPEHRYDIFPLYAMIPYPGTAHRYRLLLHALQLHLRVLLVKNASPACTAAQQPSQCTGGLGITRFFESF